jgi:hydroxyethylthiazole kinase-like uncharacterized protein yjeF
MSKQVRPIVSQAAQPTGAVDNQTLRHFFNEVSTGLVSVQEAQTFDRLTINQIGPDPNSASLELMERAAVGLADIILARIKLAQDNNPAKVLVLSGPGNNGADGIALVRLLTARGVACELLLVSAKKYSVEYQAQLARIPTNIKPWCFGSDQAQAVIAASMTDSQICSKEQVLPLLEQATIVVDALLGTGQKSAPSAAIANLLSIIAKNRNDKAKYISVDIPTGINADSGEVYRPHFVADLCICIGLVKRGLLQYPARQELSELALVDIGWSCEQSPFFEFNSPPSDSTILERAPVAHKGTFGRVLVIAGSQNFPGAAVLVANSALFSGAGLVTKAHLRGLPLPGLRPEVMLNLFGESGSEPVSFCIKDLEKLSQLIQQSDAIVLGPGLGQSSAVADLVVRLLPLLINKPTVLDADALNLIAQLSENAQVKFADQTVLTPHPGEAARLLGLDSAAQVESDRYKTILDLQQRYGGVFVLKGAATIIASESKGYVNCTGSPLLASAGSGDRLSGMIAALLARGFSALEAARLAVFRHGQLAEREYLIPWL